MKTSDKPGRQRQQPIVAWRTNPPPITPPPPHWQPPLPHPGVPSNFPIFRPKPWRGLERQSFLGIFAVMEPADLKLYRALIPDGLSMPKHPAVDMHIFAHQGVGSGLSLAQVTFVEGVVRLRCSFAGEEGWFVETIGIGDLSPELAEHQGEKRGQSAPVTPSFSRHVKTTLPRFAIMGINAADRVFFMNRNVTSAVYFADISLQTSPHWKAEVRKNGVPLWSLEFTRPLGRELTPRERTIWRQELANAPVYYRLVLSAETTVLQEQRRNPTVASRWRPKEDGFVRVVVDPQAPWAGLVPTGRKLLGRVGRYQGGMDMAVKRIWAAPLARMVPSLSPPDLRIRS